MLKKIVALAAFSVCSLNAYAGYVQYNFSDVGLSGFFVQRDGSQAIAYYNLKLQDHLGNTYFTPQGYQGNLMKVTNYIGNSGPTGFSVFVDNPTGTTFDRFTVSFEPGVPLSYAARFERQVPYAGDVDLATGTSRETYFASVTQSTVDPALVAQLDANGGYAVGIKRIPVFQAVPEPGSLALLGVGLLAAGGLRRKAKLK